MRIAERAPEFASAWRDASSEAENAFGDGRMYLEKYLLRPRHIEIQVLGDHHGNMVYLGERECSVQRRYQKVIEEAPSPVMTPDLRKAMGEAALKLARAGGYTNAGTVEFLLDGDRNFYFLEMNTRLQVEHPVTEMVTALDIVKLQIRIAAGECLPFSQEDITIRGHAIECRIYAEDPDNNFFPAPGKITDRSVPAGPGIRLDDGIYSGWTVPNEYDPLLGKLIAWDNTRTDAIRRMQRALGEYHAGGIKTNVSLFRRILNSRDFQDAAIYTRWLDDFLSAPQSETAPSHTTSDIQAAEGVSTQAEDAALLATILFHTSRTSETAKITSAADTKSQSEWKLEARRRQLDREPQRQLPKRQ